MAIGNNTRKGVYNPLFPDKCINITKVGKPPVFRSKWEATLFRAMDTNTNVVKWGSELPETMVEYIKPTDMQKHRYFPDLYVEVIDRAGNIGRWVVEVKPLEECSPPVPPKRKTRDAVNRFAVAQATWLTNEAKWKAARHQFHKIGIRFMVATEETIYKRLAK